MADRARKYIDITVDAAQALRDLNKIEKSTAATAKSVGALEKGMGFLNRAISGFAAFAVTNELVELADAAVNVQSRLSGVLEEAEQVGTVFSELNVIANQTGQRVDDLAGLYTRLASAVPYAEHEDLIGTVDLLARSLSTAGVSTQGATAVLTQFAQALGSGKVQGDEFRTINEQLPQLLRAWQQEAGLGAIALKDISEQGLFTAESFFELQERIAATTAEMIGLRDAPITVGRALNILRNELLGVLRTLTSSQENNAFGQIAERISDAANEVDRFIPILSGMSNTLVAVIDLFVEMGTVIADVMGNIGRSLGEAVESINNVFSDSRQEVADYGDFWGYVWEVLIPLSVKGAAETIKVIWESILSSAAITVASIVNVWEKIPLEIEKAFNTILLTAAEWGREIVRIGVRVGNAFGERFTGGLNSVVTAFNNLLPDALSGLQIDALTFTPFTGGAAIDFYTEQITVATQRQSELNAELEEADRRFQSVSDAAGEQAAATLSASAAALREFREQLEGNRIQRNMNELIDEEIKLKNRSAQASKESADAASGGSKRAERAAQDLERARLAAAKALDVGVKSVRDYLQALRDELELAKLTTEERELRQAAIDLEKKATDALAKSIDAERRGNLLLAESYREVAEVARAAIPEAQRLVKEIQNVQEPMETIAEDISGAFSSAFGDILRSTEDFGGVLLNLLDSILDAMIDKVVTSQLDTAFETLLSGIGSYFSTAFSGFSFFGGAGGAATTTLTSTTAASAGGISPAALAGGATNLMAPQTLVPMEGGGGGGNVVVNVTEDSRRGGERQQRRTAEGETVLDVFVARIKADIADDLQGGGGVVSGAMERTYGLSRMAGAF